jgi:transposase
MVYRTTQQNITADFVIEQLEQFSITITKPTVVVLDNARIHTARKVKERLSDWQARGLYLFYLPAYSPHLNITERLWKELKSRWLKPADYYSADLLFYTVHLALAAVGKTLFINFSDFKL